MVSLVERSHLESTDWHLARPFELPDCTIAITHLNTDPMATVLEVSSFKRPAAPQACSECILSMVHDAVHRYDPKRESREPDISSGPSG